MTSCGCFESISVVLPMCNGVMTVDRDHTGMTPCGMKFSTLAGSVGGGAQTPGFVGHSKFYMGSSKFISGDGGVARVVWMPKKLKEELEPALRANSEKAGHPDLYDKIADRGERDGGGRDPHLSHRGRSSRVDDGPAVLAQPDRGGGSAAPRRARSPRKRERRKERHLALSGLQIFKLLPKTNCKDCGFPTCMAFAMQLAAGKAELSQCPDVSAEAAAELGEAAAPPVRKVTIGAGDNAVVIGEETVLYRHEKRFEHPPGIAILVDDSVDDAAFDQYVETFKTQEFDRVGQILRVKLFAVESADAAKLAARVQEGVRRRRRHGDHERVGRRP